jgi:acyl-CoA synthetase (AMP-forming)/AMP-acid ligase II
MQSDVKGHGHDRMNFLEIIQQVTRSPVSQENLLKDAQLTCAYRDIPELFDRLDEWFDENRVAAEDYLAYECVNTVPGALTLLYLLKSGVSFVLLPPLSSRNGKPGVPSFLPQFCKYKVTLQSLPFHSESRDLRNPQNFIQISPNEHWSESFLPQPPDQGPKVFLRTSGSIGSPKMVAHSHAKLLGNALNCVQRFRLNSDDRITVPVPIFHMYGFGAGFLPGFFVGASLDLQETPNILTYLARERQFNQNVVYLTPTLGEMLLKGRRRSEPYKLVVTAGDRIKPETFRAFDTRLGNLVNLYGSTEMGAIAASEPDDTVNVRTATVGPPFPGVSMQLREITLDAGTEADGIGKLYCRHRYGFEGYVDSTGHWIGFGSEAAPEWFETRDLGRILPNGYVEVLGRCDHSVNRNGLLVLYSDIELAVESLAGLERSFVVVQGESRRGDRVIACCLPKKEFSLQPDQLRTACFQVLPRHAVPDEIRLLSTMPTLPNGKINRVALAEMPAQPLPSQTYQVKELSS